MGRPAKNKVSLTVEDGTGEIVLTDTTENKTNNSEPQVVEEEQKIKEPEMTSLEWNDYVLSKLAPYEIYDGRPKVDGLRRVAQMLLGEVVFSGPTQMDIKNGIATVIYKVSFLWNRDDDRLGREVEFYGVGDSTPENTQHPFNRYLAVMADIRAEGRALKRALGLRCLFAEEANPNLVLNETEKVTSTQWAAIEKMCRQLDVNVNKLLVSVYGELGLEYQGKETLTKEYAKTALQKLNNYQVDPSNDDYKIIPQELKGY